MNNIVAPRNAIVVVDVVHSQERYADPSQRCLSAMSQVTIGKSYSTVSNRSRPHTSVQNNISRSHKFKTVETLHYAPIAAREVETVAAMAALVGDSKTFSVTAASSPLGSFAGSVSGEEADWDSFDLSTLSSDSGLFFLAFFFFFSIPYRDEKLV